MGREHLDFIIFFPAQIPPPSMQNEPSLDPLPLSAIHAHILFPDPIPSTSLLRLLFPFSLSPRTLSAFA